MFDKAIVALDLSKMDETLISYSTFIAQKGGLKKVGFVHVSPARNAIWPDEERTTFHSDGEEAVNSLRAELEQKIRSSTDALRNTEVEVSVLHGTPYEELLRSIQHTRPSLVVLGKKQISDGSGVSALQVVRQVGAAIWFVTTGAQTQKRSLLVPLDFSENSFRALQAALHLKRQSPEIEITTLHVIDVPLTANKVHHDKNAIIAKMKTTATNKFLQFLHEHQIDRNGIKLELVINDRVDVAGYIQQTAVSEEADLIVIGGKGQSFLNNFLFGSVTEALVTAASPTPILVIR